MNSSKWESAWSEYGAQGLLSFIYHCFPEYELSRVTNSGKPPRKGLPIVMTLDML